MRLMKPNLATQTNSEKRKCAYCGNTGTTEFLRSEVSTKRGVGVVGVSDDPGDYIGGEFSAGADVEKLSMKEVPIVETTRVAIFRCRSCGFSWSSKPVKSITQVESSPPSKPIQTLEEGNENHPSTILIREIETVVVKVPCAHCRTLVDLARDNKCPSCGAPVKI